MASPITPPITTEIVLLLVLREMENTNGALQDACLSGK
jgi:hypothetical protein